jgi:hypothetical protein
MEDEKNEQCCEIGVKGSCANCDFAVFCNGKWSRQQ